MRAWARPIVGVALWLPSMFSQPAAAQNQFGGQDRVDAANRLVRQGVQQAISALPPTSSQSLVFRFDLANQTYERAESLGPLVLRSPETIGKHTGSVRVTTSYFEASAEFEPATYLIEPIEPLDPTKSPNQSNFVKFGLNAGARVSVTSLSAIFGVADGVELSANLPLVVTDASAALTFSTLPELGGVVGHPRSESGLDGWLRDGTLEIGRGAADDLGFRFDDGARVGLGRVGIGAKVMLPETSWLQIAVAPEIFLPSPNSDDLAGSDTFMLSTDVIARLTLGEWPSLYANVGYDYDFDDAELRRLFWRSGVSRGWDRFSVDLGLGGSVYDSPIRWTPAQARSVDDGFFNPTTVTLLGANDVDKTFFHFLGGLKLRLSERSVVGGAVTVPIRKEGLLPDIVWTLSLELYM